MKFSDYKIGARLTAAFGVTVLLALLVGGMAMYQITTISRLNKDLYDHPFTVTNAMKDLRRDIIYINLLLNKLDPGVDAAGVDQLEREIAQRQKNIEDMFKVVADRFLGDQRDVNVAKSAFEEWRGIIAEGFRSWRMVKGDIGHGNHFDRARSYFDQVFPKTQAMVDFAMNKAHEYFMSAEKTRGQAQVLLTVFCLCIAVLGYVVSRSASKSITLPLETVVGAMRRLAQGNVEESLDMARGDELGELADSFREMQAGIRNKAEVAKAIARGYFDTEVELAGEKDLLGMALTEMSIALSQEIAHTARTDWQKTGMNELAARLAGEQDLRTLADKVVSFLAKYLKVQIGAVYVLSQGGDVLVLAGSYAFTKRKGMGDVFELGQGLVGQAAKERQIISLSKLPEDYIRVNSALGEVQPRNIVLVPLVHEGQLKGVIELGSVHEVSDDSLEFLRSASVSIAQAVSMVENHDMLRDLLERTQIQSDKLRQSQEELQAVNEELEQQASALRNSEEILRQQQEELQTANEELEQKNSNLERQRAEISAKNADLENIRKNLEQKALELEKSTRYKSEFLANMSHELRTPLNSLLLLSRSLMENQKGNLDTDQVEYSRIIHRSGNDLLNLINEILDLSKIEAGKMTINRAEFPIMDLAESMTAVFRPMLEEKGLVFSVEVDERLPENLCSDQQRVEQILRNLLSNAVKFTDAGSVALRFLSARKESEGKDVPALEISVADTGMGIPVSKHRDIFEAFQQAEGGTARRYGGTGLGLTISQELARLLGGSITVASEEGKGSVFTLLLPLDTACPIRPGEKFQPTPGGAGKDDVLAGPGRIGGTAPAVRQDQPARPIAQPPVPDDRLTISQGDHVILLIEDDPVFAGVLAGQCRAKGFKILAATTGEDGLALARLHQPGAVLLDIRLPGMDGLQVLDEIKEDPSLRHIPVHVMSGVDGGQDALRRGAIGFLAKPATQEGLNQALGQLEGVMAKQIKDLLLVEDDDALRRGVIDLIGDSNVRIHEARDGASALAAIRERPFDCMVLDLGLPDMTGFELLDSLAKEFGPHVLPVIVYTGRELSKQEEQRLREYADSIIIKGVRSEERLIDETALFLHQMVKNLPQRKREVIIGLHDKDAALKDKTVLLVDDDMRNLFALAQVLQGKGIRVLKAEDGQKALEVLESDPTVDMVLLDIMMPVMDGYETARRIREQRRFASLPVIALTAKAMREDREKCIAAGCNDYIAKPVDLDRLLSVMRVWLYK